MVLKVVILFVIVYSVWCKPLDSEGKESSPMDSIVPELSVASNAVAPPTRLWKKFINPVLTYGGYIDSGVSKMRTKRSSAEDCERLELCILHARSSRNFLSAFELYFVNKENAQLWDHHSRSLAECRRRFPAC